MITTVGEKQPYEEYYLTFDFVKRLDGALIESVAGVAAIEVITGSVVTSSLTDSTKQANTDTVVQVWVRAGETGKKYKVTCQVIADDGKKLELDAILPVRAR